MGKLNQHQIMGIAAMCFALFAVILTLYKDRYIKFVGMPATYIGMFMLVGAVSCIGTAGIITTDCEC